MQLSIAFDDRPSYPSCMSESEKVFPPRPMPNAQIREFDLTGYLFPWHQNAPVAVTLSGTNDLFLMVFSTLEKLKSMVQVINLPFDSIKQIDHPIEFFESIPTHVAPDQRLRIIVDAYQTEDGNTRFSEIVRN